MRHLLIMMLALLFTVSSFAGPLKNGFDKFCLENGAYCVNIKDFKEFSTSALQELCVQDGYMVIGITPSDVQTLKDSIPSEYLVSSDGMQATYFFNPGENKAAECLEIIAPQQGQLVIMYFDIEPDSVATFYSKHIEPLKEASKSSSQNN